MKVGFVGLGLMGRPMVRRLLHAGFDVSVASANQEAMAELAEDGATTAGSISELAASVEIFCACRVTPEQSREVFLGEGGVKESAAPGLTCIDFATIDPATSRAIGQALATVGVDYLDAPISGGPDGAAAGALSIIIGGSDEAVRKAGPVLDAVGKKTFHMGAVGAGVTAKLCNNMISITTHALVAEAMVLGVKAGVDAHALYEVLRHSSAYSRTLERVVPAHFLKRDFRPAATVATIMKDLECALETGRTHGVRLLLPSVALQCYVDAAGRGHKHEDIAAVILPMEEIAGVKVGES